MPQFDAVAFDLDGTLIDSTDGIVVAFEAAYTALGLAYPGRDAVVSTISMPLEDQMDQLRIDDAETFITVYRSLYGAIADDQTRLFAGAETMLRSLHRNRVPIAVATSKSKPAAIRLLKHLGMFPLFDACIGREDVTHAKPHPEALLRAAEVLEVSPERTVYIGDSAFDVEAARRAKMGFIGVTTGAAGAAGLIDADPGRCFENLHGAADCLYPAVGIEASQPRVNGETR